MFLFDFIFFYYVFIKNISAVSIDIKITHETDFDKIMLNLGDLVQLKI